MSHISTERVSYTRTNAEKCIISGKVSARSFHSHSLFLCCVPLVFGEYHLENSEFRLEGCIILPVTWYLWSTVRWMLVGLVGFRCLWGCSSETPPSGIAAVVPTLRRNETGKRIRHALKTLTPKQSNGASMTAVVRKQMIVGCPVVQVVGSCPLSGRLFLVGSPKSETVKREGLPYLHQRLHSDLKFTFAVDTRRGARRGCGAETHVWRGSMPPNRQDAKLERLCLAWQVDSVEAVPKAQEVTTRCSFLFVSNFAYFEFLKLVVLRCCCSAGAAATVGSLRTSRKLSCVRQQCQACAEIRRADVPHRM